ncbi:PRP38-domain-containing protein [Anaeromyces robustus]|uniref:Pre-mRNA-splicing factor 38 n=1 Tax=Anaeromyces robustus TaxID=1754192 RepID=A0A1Y1VUA4_9FUNG|nr:PRP38-domain-containing protein [Anaeromyces robustus]|eukprot:ORX64889.1 PRP38-domain-containing protein [Anaeromyces robustus]
MANRTVSDAKNIHGTNPQYLLEKIIRSRIYESLYWKEDCFGLTAESLIDKADQLPCIGGQYGNQKPTEFLCLTLKLLQLQPEKEIIIDFIRNEDSKYLRALGAFYFRLIGDSLEIYKYLEPLLYDFRKLRRRLPDGAYDIIHMDEFIDSLLRDERVCDTILPRILKRQVLEDNEELEPRVSFLEDELEQEALAAAKKEKKDRSRSRSSSRVSCYRNIKTINIYFYKCIINN